MFLGCIASPALLGILSGKDIFFPKVFNGNMGAAGAILYIPVLFIVSGFSEIKMSGRTMLFYTYGLITFCIGAFLMFTLSWWYIFISIYAFVFLFLLYSENYATR